MRRSSDCDSLTRVFADEFMPIYGVSDELATRCRRRPGGVWEALMDAGLLEVGKSVPAAGVIAVLEVLLDQRECLHFAGGQPTRLTWEAS